MILMIRHPKESKASTLDFYDVFKCGTAKATKNEMVLFASDPRFALC
jgi:hypothetical protein